MAFSEAEIARIVEACVDYSVANGKIKKPPTPEERTQWAKEVAASAKTAAQIADQLDERLYPFFDEWRQIHEGI